MCQIPTQNSKLVVDILTTISVLGAKRGFAYNWILVKLDLTVT